MGIEIINETLQDVGDTERVLIIDGAEAIGPSTSTFVAPSLVRERGDQTSKPSTVPFNPYLQLSRFIDSLPTKLSGEGETAPPLVTVGSRYKAMSEKLLEHLANIPGCFSKPVKFFWNHELSIVKENGVEVLLGAGRLGNVFLGRNAHGEYFAMKYFNIIRRQDHSDLVATVKEALMQDRMSRKNAAPEFRGFGFIMKNSHYYQIILVSTFIPAQPRSKKSLTLSALCLEDAARRRNGYPPLLLSHQYFQLLHRITNKVAALQECRIVHTDIKFDNILLHLREGNQYVEPFIIDYGSSHAKGYCKSPLFKHDTEQEARKFLRRYRQCAPEILFAPRNISTKTDIYSLGLVFRGIGYFLDIPPLVCLANKLRFEKQEQRPNCEEISGLIHRVFGQKLVENINTNTNAANTESRCNTPVDKCAGNLQEGFRDVSCMQATQDTTPDKESSDEASNDPVANQLCQIIVQIRNIATEFCKEDIWKNLLHPEPEVEARVQ